MQPTTIYSTVHGLPALEERKPCMPEKRQPFALHKHALAKPLVMRLAHACHVKQRQL